PAQWHEASQAGADGDLAPLEAVFARVVSRASL
ncbi:MAG TPA: putative adenosine monophosphate-protein transferase Fic, partial [Pantoea septica]|nr:putative adenosine monophosphate-protein transferase Fic [Pantoea septica]